MRFARQDLCLAGRFFERPGHLELFPVYCAVLPVGRGGAFVQYVPAELPLLEDKGSSAGRILLVAVLALFVPLSFAEDHDIGGTGVVKQRIEADVLTVHDHLVIVHHFDMVDGTDTWSVGSSGGVFAAGVFLITPQSVRVHKVFSRELTIAVMELHAFL